MLTLKQVNTGIKGKWSPCVTRKELWALWVCHEQETGPWYGRFLTQHAVQWVPHVDRVQLGGWQRAAHGPVSCSTARGGGGGLNLLQWRKCLDTVRKRLDLSALAFFQRKVLRFISIYSILKQRRFNLKQCDNLERASSESSLSSGWFISVEDWFQNETFPWRTIIQTVMPI